MQPCSVVVTLYHLSKPTDALWAAMDHSALVNSITALKAGFKESFIWYEA